MLASRAGKGQFRLMKPPLAKTCKITEGSAFRKPQVRHAPFTFNPTVLEPVDGYPRLAHKLVAMVARTSAVDLLNARLRKYREVVALALLVPLLFSCADENDDSVVEIATLWIDNSVPAVEVPATSRVNETLEIKFGAEGNSCVSYESTDIELTPDGPVVTPYNRRKTNVICSQFRYYIEHRALLAFDSPGMHLVHIHGIGRDANLVDFAYAIDVSE